MEVERKQSVVLVPYLLQGHLTPMLQLGSILHSQGFSVIVAHTQYNSPNYSNHPQFIFHSMDDGLKGFGMSFPSAPLRNYLVRMMEEEGDQLACIIYDNVMFFVDDVATQLKLPSIVLRTFSAACMNSMVTIFQQPEKYFPFEDSQLLDPLPELHPLRFKDVPIHVINNTNNDIGSSVATIWNTMQDLENSMLLRLQKHYKVPFFPIGPFSKMVPLASSTNKPPNSVLYVSLGSLVRIDEKELIETAWGLANSEQHVLVGYSTWLCPWLSIEMGTTKQVLAHPAIAGFFTHCDWNSTLESICEEVPMICRPILADQLVNARCPTQIYKVGFELEVMERTVIENIIRKLMLSEEGKDVKKRVVDMKQNIVAGMQIDGTSHTNLKDLVDFISALTSRLPPPTPVVGVIMSSNHTSSKCIRES
ncbi:hypothetical protein R3W88_027768 [Solanum pinnatisectum]|uniref:Glycosyltransferase n=1 Tax=Solanum pinnatisectum TaxID=50273 RepID=A0AAV9LH48_9SOLN|nr:hypothetical protein R3W88_027768 [Solanum pinnatisectum]